MKPKKKSKLSIEISESLYKSFLPARWYMMIFAKFPFSVKKKEDGTYGYELSKYSPQAILFYINTVFHIIIFIFFTAGTIHAYFTPNDLDYPKDSCGQTWETTMFLRHFDVIIFSITSFGVSGFSGFFLWYYRDDFCHYFNFWSIMMQKLQFDCTKGTLRKMIQDYIIFLGLAVISLVLYFYGKLIPMEEASGFFMQTLVFFIRVKNLYAYDAPGGLMNVSRYRRFSENCCKCGKDCHPDSFQGAETDNVYCMANCWNVHSNPSFGYRAMKLSGYLIQIYAMMSTVAMFIMFEFYCRCLVNYSKCWNARLSYGVSADRHEDSKDECRRRIKLKPLMLDFGALAEIFQMTEELFGNNLAVYYGMLMLNFLTQVYFFVLSERQKTCSEWILENLNIRVQEYLGTSCDNLEQVLLPVGPNEPEPVSFEDPCFIYQNFRQQQVWLGLILLAFTMYMFMSTIWEGHQAVHQGLQGFLRLRKFNYMSAMNLKEKYFVHTLKLTYLGPCAIHISAANFFVIRRKLAILVIGTCLVYMMMLIGFRPGQIKPLRSCKSHGKYIFHYPRITG